MPTVQIKTSEVHALCVDALVSAGLSPTEAAIVADDYVEAEASGRVSHGLAGFDIAVADAKRRGTASATVVRDSPAMTVVDGNGEMGHLVFAAHIDEMTEKARGMGTAVLALARISRVASPATVARAFASRRLASITLEYGGQAFVAPPDHHEPSVSTNPIAIGFPRLDDPPLVLDMATSARAFFFVKLAEALGEPIPVDWARDADGNGVTDPAAAHSLAPFGGYKGFGLAFMFEVLTGPMLGVPVGRAGELAVRGMLTIVLDPEAFGRSLDDIDRDVARLIQDLDGARHPGQSSGARLAHVRGSGTVDVESATLEKLRGLAVTSREGTGSTSS